MHVSTSWIYILILMSAAYLAFYSIRNPQRVAPPRLVFNYVLAHQVSRFALLVIWWWLGWHFLGSLQEI